jgi:hypothetical protein
MTSYDLWSSIFWILFALAAIGLSSRLSFGTFYEPGSGLFPLLLSFIILGFGLTLFLKTLFKSKRKLKDVSYKGFENTVKVLPILILLILYTLFLEKVGFLVVTFSFILLLLLVTYRQKWWLAFITALAGSFGSYVIFQIWLKSQLPKGILGF